MITVVYDESRDPMPVYYSSYPYRHKKITFSFEKRSLEYVIQNGTYWMMPGENGPDWADTAYIPVAETEFKRIYQYSIIRMEAAFQFVTRATNIISMSLPPQQFWKGLVLFYSIVGNKCQVDIN